MKKSKIKNIKAREILNSRGEPAIEAEIETNDGNFFASVPSGASKGKYEARELRDKDKRYQGKGVLKAINNIEKIIAPKLKGKNPCEQKKIDEIMRELDGTNNKSKLGANAILAVSIAVCRAGAGAQNIALSRHIAYLSKLKQTKQYPLPCLLMIEGGLHAGNNLDFQEFMLIPAYAKNSFSKNLEMQTEIYHELGKIIEKKFGRTAINVGMEGGFAPPIKSSEQALDLIARAVKKCGSNNKVKIIIDAAASEFYENKKYKINGKIFTNSELLNYYKKLVKKYPIAGIEDPFAENDLQGWQMAKKLPCQFIIGDDLTVTNLEKIKTAKQNNFINAVIIKPNQIGTVSETIDSSKFAADSNIKIFVKHRSGETNDDFIADLAIGIGAYGIMAGAPCRGERTAKYNRLLKLIQ
ncbi:phosphopyruvate hydratase [Candidatus Parcubacteria bacterium]|nr:phosphopyruvate hydratase [Candidatus Parcubacteria bacterium]